MNEDRFANNSVILAHLSPIFEMLAGGIVFRWNFTSDRAANLDVNSDRVLADGELVSNNVEINERFIIWPPNMKDFPQKLKSDSATGEVVNQNAFGVFPAGRCTIPQAPKQ